MDITLPLLLALISYVLGIFIGKNWGQVCKRVNNTINRKEKWKIKFGYKK